VPVARRRLGLVGLTYGYRALAGLLIALPVAMVVGGPLSAWPNGQAHIFDPGGVMLVEALRFMRHGIGPVAVEALVVAALATIAGVIPLAILLCGLDREGPLPAGFLAGRAVSRAGTLALLSVVTLPAQAIVGALLGLAGTKLVGAFDLTATGTDMGNAAVVAVVVAAVCALGVLRDLAFAAAVRSDLRFYSSAANALRVARRSGARAFGAWAYRAALGVAGLALAAWLAPPLAGASAAAVAVGVVLHQAAIVGMVFARASWLAAALRLHDAGPTP
jgi:hypothetical protein